MSYIMIGCLAIKTDRAKEWEHWFLRDDNTCEFNQVERTVNQLRWYIYIYI